MLLVLLNYYQTIRKNQGLLFHKFIFEDAYDYGEDMYDSSFLAQFSLFWLFKMPPPIMDRKPSLESLVLISCLVFENSWMQLAAKSPFTELNFDHDPFF